MLLYRRSKMLLSCRSARHYTPLQMVTTPAAWNGWEVFATLRIDVAAASRNAISSN